MNRRSFLRAIGFAAVATTGGGVLAACGRRGGGDAAATIPGGEPTLSVINASFEVLSGNERRVNLVVLEHDQTPVEGAEVSTFVRDLEGEVLTGPHEATWYDESGSGTGTGVGLYQTVLPLAEPGTFEIVAVTGERYGTAAVNVVSPSESAAPVPGDPAIVTATPTPQADLGVSPMCTRDPACGMHEVSLDEALSSGRPVMLLFATPAYCQTAACGPVVDSLEAVRSDGDWEDVAFIHVEIYRQPPEDGIELSPPVQEWQLPTEPWLFAVDREGMIADRMDGPMLAKDLSRIAESLL